MSPSSTRATSRQRGEKPSHPRLNLSMSNLGEMQNQVLHNIMEGRWNKKPFEPKVENTHTRDAFFSLNMQRTWNIDVSEQTFKASVVFEIYWEPTGDEKELFKASVEKSWRNRHLEETGDPSFSGRVIQLTKQPEWKASDYIFDVENALHDELKWDKDPVVATPLMKSLYMMERIRVTGSFIIAKFYEVRRSSWLPEIEWFPAPFDVLRLPCTFKFRYSEINLRPISSYNLGPETFFIFNRRVCDDTYEFKNAMFEQLQDSYNSDIYYMHATICVSRNLWAFVLRTLAPIPLSTILPMLVYSIPRENFFERMEYLLLCLLVFSIYSVMLLNTGKKLNNAYTYSDILVLGSYVFYAGIVGAVICGEKWDFTVAMEDLVTMAISGTWLALHGGWILLGIREGQRQNELLRTPLGRQETLQDSAGLVSKEGLVRLTDKEGSLHYAASLRTGIEHTMGKTWEMYPCPDPRIGLQTLSEVAVEHFEHPYDNIDQYIGKLAASNTMLGSLHNDALRRVVTNTTGRASGRFNDLTHPDLG